MSILNKKNILLIASVVNPYFAFAQNRINSTNATTLADSIRSVITGRLIPLMLMLALIYTMYAAVEFIRENDDSQAREEKKQKIFWGLIGLFVIVSIWALVAVVANTFNIFAGGTLQ